MYAFFEQLLNPLTASTIERPPNKTGGFFLYYLWPMRRLLCVTLIISGIAAASELFLYVFLGQLVDHMAVTAPTDFIDEHGTSLVVMLVVAALIRPVSLIASRLLISLVLVPGLTNLVRWRNHQYVLRQSLQYFHNDFAGRIAQKVMQTGPALREAAVNVIDGVWLLAIYLCGTLYLFAQIDSRLLAPIALWLSVYIAVIVWQVPPVKQRSAKLSEANSDLTGRVVDSYTNIQTVKLFAPPSREDEFAAASVARHTRAFRDLMRSVMSMTITLIVLNTLLIVGNALLSLQLWIDGTVSVGAIAVCNGLVIRLSQMSGWILRTITALFENIGTVENGIRTISQPISVADKPRANTLNVTRGEVHFDRINFRYGDDNNAIDSLTLKVEGGEKVGIVGRSGAGKSTLVNLLLRFYDLEAGRILIDNQDIHAVDQYSLRSSIAMVTQDTSLLHRSIRDNISYGAKDATDEAVAQAARLAEAHLFIPDLVDPAGRTGYDAFVGERGVKLSGGQRQRIALARVILKNAPILVLDEATSALDSEVEAAIQHQLTHLMQGKTVIAIAHRLSTIAALDRLIVMDDGAIVEQGNHDDLLAFNGLYASLWRRQSGGFLGIT